MSFDVPSGSILGVIGPSGSGKTTTIRMLMGSLAPTEGSVRVLGEVPTSFRSQTRERIGYMPQQFVLYPDLTARENVDFVASLFGMLFVRRRRRTRHVLELLELWDARKRRAGDMSGGMQRRLELACALVHEPRLLILDEPTAGIDPILRRTIWDELHRLREQGVTSVVTTQYVTEAEECDMVALIADGRLIALAPPEALRRDAYGGDIVDVTTEATFDGNALATLRSVRSVRQSGLHDFSVVVDDASVAIPEIVDAIGAAGGTVASVREARPSFEDVFAELVERAKAKHAAEAEAESQTATPGNDAAPAADAAADTEAAAADPIADPMIDAAADSALPADPAMPTDATDPFAHAAADSDPLVDPASQGDAANEELPDGPR
ncbi:MAG: ABC transporter ATP-binding protein [Candidatus Limnocylindrales bacterium]